MIVYKRGKGLPILGAFHASDLANAYAPNPAQISTSELQDAIIYFTNSQDPNPSIPPVTPSNSSSLSTATLVPSTPINAGGPAPFAWPKYTAKGMQMLSLEDGDNENLATRTVVIKDDFRDEARDYLARVVGDVYQ